MGLEQIRMEIEKSFNIFSSEVVGETLLVYFGTPKYRQTHKFKNFELIERREV